MADDAVALYGAVKKMAQAMAEREAALDQKTAALQAAVAELERLPAALGRQTAQYIAAGVKASIQDDFSRPIAAAVQGPIADLSRETHHARIVMEQVGREVRYQSWTWVVALLLLGFACGGAAGYYFFVRDLGSINDRIDAIQTQLAPQAPAQPASGKGGAPARKTRPRSAQEAPKEPGQAQPHQP
jgi:hypothetical protein